jgi:hypothetical protein
VTLDGRLYEAPVGLMGKTVTLLYHTNDPLRVEIWDKEQSAGSLVPLDQAINSRIRRDKSLMPALDHDSSSHPEREPLPTASYRSGALFSSGAES